MCNDDNLNTKEKLEIAIQSGLQLIPYIGAPLCTAYFGTKQAKEFKRIERLYSDLAEEISKSKEKIADFNEQNEDSLISLIEQVNDRVEKEHQEEKYQCYKNYMKKILISPVNSENYDKRKTFLDTLGLMSLLECEMLIFLYQHSMEDIIVGNITKKGVDQYAIVGNINKLRSYGFVKNITGSIAIGNNTDNTLSEHTHITDYGKEFVEFVIK